MNATSSHQPTIPRVPSRSRVDAKPGVQRGSLVARSILVAGFLAAAIPSHGADQAIELVLRTRDRDSGRLSQTPAEWKPSESVFIICDMWDAHHSRNATLRTGEVAPRIDALARALRDRGVLIIHAPSDCMAAYEGHPARIRAMGAPPSDAPPQDIGNWCHWKDAAEESAGYPIDHSDGGEDDDDDTLVQWHAELERQGRKPGSPWLRQIESIAIDPEQDAISDRGIEIWNLLEARGIRNVMIAGVHTNMCVLGRPFGLRQMSRNGMNTVLVRDLTDTMYNPRMRPFVSHFEGTDLVVAHIERHVCATVDSAQMLGGTTFRFRDDHRRSALLVASEPEYQTGETVPRFLETRLSDAFRFAFALEDPRDANRLTGLERLDEADLLIISARRRALPLDQLARIRRHVAAGKPVVALRTASHAFALRDGEIPPDGRDVWPEFDAEVLGGNYQGHHGNDRATEAWVPDSVPVDEPLVAGIDLGENHAWPTGGSLYRNSPLRAGSRILVMGRALGIEQPEPVAWTTTGAGGDSRVFYTSLGHALDFDRPEFRQLLENACRWAVDLPTDPDASAR